MYRAKRLAGSAFRYHQVGASDAGPTSPASNGSANREGLGVECALTSRGGRMASVFTKIIDGELPGRFVWKDDRAVAFLTINPVKPGHTLVVPRDEVDHWIDLEPDLAKHVMGVCHGVGRAIHQAFRPKRVGQAIVGIEVPHVHVHLIPIDAIADLDFSKADPNPKPEDLDVAAERIRRALRDLGHAEVAES